MCSIQNAKHHVQTFHPSHELKVGHIKGLVDPKSTLKLNRDTGSHLEDLNWENNISDDGNTDTDSVSEIGEEGQSEDLKSVIKIMPSFVKKLSTDQMSIYSLHSFM